MKDEVKNVNFGFKNQHSKLKSLNSHRFLNKPHRKGYIA